jgi:hypothetical protein
MSLTRARSLDNTISYSANSLSANVLFANGINLYPYVTAAYASANNVAPQVQPAFNQANAAYLLANSAYAAANAAGSSTYVQAAYNTANVALGALGNYTSTFPTNNLGFVSVVTSGLGGDYKPNLNIYDNKILPSSSVITIVDLGPTLT